MMTLDRIDPQDAFRTGLRGLALAEARSDYRGSSSAQSRQAPRGGLREEAAAFAGGRNEELVAQTRRLAGLFDAQGAYETGRALLAIAKLFDRAQAPASLGEQFLSNLQAAVIAHRSRRVARPWSGEDTIAMFMELYDCVLGAEDEAKPLVRDKLLAYAKNELAPMPGTRAATPTNPYKRKIFGLHSIA